MLIRIISNVQSFALGIVEPFIKLLHEDNNNDDEGKCNDVLSKLSFSSNPSCDSSESNSLTTNTLGIIAKSSFSLIRPLVMRATLTLTLICGCIKALPLPVKSFVVTSTDQLNPLVESVASLDTLDAIVVDDTLPRLTLPTETCLVATSFELVVASSTDLVTTNDEATLVEIDDEETYFPNALTFVLIGCLIILLALECGIIRSDAAILCLGIFQAVILEYNYQMISSFVAVLMKSLIVIFTSSSNVDLDDAGKVAEGEELAAPTLGSFSLCLDMPSSTVSNELTVPIDVSTAIVDGSNSSDVSIEPYKSCLVALLLLIFTSLVEIVDVLSVVQCIISISPMVFTSLVDIVDTLSFIDWLILLTLVVGSIIIMTTKSTTTINTSASSALDDVETVTDVPFNLMGTLRACLSSGVVERHSLLVAFLLMACAPIPVMVAVLMVLLDSWTILQALVVATCLVYTTTYTTKALQSIPTHLRGSTSALVNRITTICNIITTESFLLTLLLMVIVPLMGIVVIMMMLILVSFNWSVVIQVLVECTMMIPSCLPGVRQACGVVTLMMCLKVMTYYLLRMWQYQLSIVFTFLDVIGASAGPLINITSRLFIVVSFALTYYDYEGGAISTTRGGMLSSTTVRAITPRGLMNTVRDILFSASAYTLNSIWMILAWFVKKFIYLIVYTLVLLVHVFMLLVQFIDYKAVVYHSVTCLIRLPICIVWRFLGRLADALLGCIIYLYSNIKSLILAPFNQFEQKEEPLPPPPAIAVSDDEDGDDEDSTIDFGAADPVNDCVGIDQDVPLPPPPPKRRTRRRRYPPAVWHRGRGGRGGLLRPRRPG